MDISKDDFFHSRGFGKELGFGQRPAVITVDFMKAFTDPTQPLGADYSAQLKAANTIIAKARDHPAPIFHTIVAYEHPDLLDAGLWRLKQEGTWALRAGSDAVALDSRLNFEALDQVLVKKYASAFFGTDLVTRINSAEVDTLIILGCTTSGCVRATAVDAVQLGIRPIVVEDAVGDRDAAAHTQSLFDLQQRYADVLSAAEVKRRWPSSSGRL